VWIDEKNGFCRVTLTEKLITYLKTCNGTA
jgi:hypothetical protein